MDDILIRRVRVVNGSTVLWRPLSHSVLARTAISSVVVVVALRRRHKSTTTIALFADDGSYVHLF